MLADTTFPDFVIAGAPKCGTTYVYEVLSRHSQVFMSDPKEPHFFASDLASPHYITDHDTYRSLFKDALSGQVCGEASVHYLYSKVAISALLQTNPAAKIITMLRNPVDMVASWHTQLLFIGEEDETDLEKAWDLQSQRKNGDALPKIFGDAYYQGVRREPWMLQYQIVCSLGEQLQRLLGIAPASQTLVLLLDDLRESPERFHRELTEFLSIDALKSIPHNKVNASRVARSARLARFLNWSPVINSAWFRSLAGAGETLHFHPLRSLRRWNTQVSKAQDMRPEFRAHLCDVFESEISTIEHLLQRDLSHWRSA